MGQNISTRVSDKDALGMSAAELATLAKQSTYISTFVVEKIEEFEISGEVASELEESDIHERCGDTYTNLQKKQLCAALRIFR